MTCGIYLLTFKGTEKLYVGQSFNIESRFSSHLSHLRCSTHSRKMNAAYKEYGLPSLEIETECEEDQKILNSQENYYIDLWDAVNNGFNSMCLAENTPKSILLGENNPNCKISNLQVKHVLSLLISEELYSYKEISSITEVAIPTIADIASLRSHKWLSKEMPVEYKELISSTINRNSAVYKGITYPLIISPTGEIFQVTNTSQFAKEHLLDNGHLGKVLNGKALSHKGWKVFNKSKS